LENKGRSTRQNLSINGAVELSRRRYGGPGQSVVPADCLVDELEKSVSLGAQEFCCRVGIGGGNFDRAAENLGQTAGLRLSGEKLRQIVQQRGRHVQQVQRKEQLELDWSVKDCRVREGPGEGQSRIYLGVDGAMAPTVTDAEKRLRLPLKALGLDFYHLVATFLFVPSPAGKAENRCTAESGKCRRRR
jgi:hypothetical protein